MKAISSEIKAWWGEMVEGVSRIKNASIRLDDTNILAVLVGFIESTYSTLPLTLTYLTVSSFLVWGTSEIALWIL